MTKQEQIAEMAVIGCVRNPQAHTAEECSKCDFKQGMCNAYRHAEALYNAGYSDVSEYKAEIKQLKAEYEQAKIDVLNELKTRHDYAIKNMGYPWDISQQIDELIKEIEKQ